jgi:hypothetical protein
MAWRVARSLETLLNQLNAAYPTRSKASDGSIGDTNHLAEGWTASDHNPWYPVPSGGIVTARDYTHDPANGVDIGRLSDELAASRDHRIKYVIANGWIMDARPQFRPWQWIKYTGTNPHDHHLHLSVIDSGACDEAQPWQLPMLTHLPPVITPPVPAPAGIPDLAEGDSGEWVRRVQVWANKEFPLYSHLIADGIYGPATSKVLAEFQKRAGIIGGDGRNIGPQTKAAMIKYRFKP